MVALLVLLSYPSARWPNEPLGYPFRISRLARSPTTGKDNAPHVMEISASEDGLYPVFRCGLHLVGSTLVVSIFIWSQNFLLHCDPFIGYRVTPPGGPTVEGPTPSLAFAKLWQEAGGPSAGSGGTGVATGVGKTSSQQPQPQGVAMAMKLGNEAFGLTGCPSITSFIQGLPGAER